MADKNLSGLSDQEAREVHGGFVQVMILFVAIAVVAHILMWMWKPWITGV
jgi:light-harvesting complex 1 beta chain